MRQDFREFSGFGELLCLVLAWTVGIVAVWSDYAGQVKSAGGEKIAASGAHRGASAYFD
jgi:hypothetical protein